MCRIVLNLSIVVLISRIIGAECYDDLFVKCLFLPPHNKKTCLFILPVLLSEFCSGNISGILDI